MRHRARLAVILACISAVLLTLMPAATLPAHAEPVPNGLEIFATVEDPQLVFADDTEVTWLVRNMGTEPVEAGRAQLRLAREPMSSPADILSEHPSGSRPTSIAVVPTPALEPGESRTFTEVVPATSFPFSMSSKAGVYGTDVRWSPNGVFSIDTASSAFRSAPLIWRSFSVSGTLQVASILPILFPAHSAPPITPEQVDEQLLRDSVVERLLETANSYDVTLAVDPKIVGSVRALGDAASVTASSIAEDLTSGIYDTVTLQYADADPVVQLTSKAGELLSESNLSYLTRWYRGDQLAPTREALTSWDTSLDGVAWPAPGTVSAATVSALRDAGFETVVISGDDASGAARGTVNGTDVFISNLALEAAAIEHVQARTATERSLALGRLTALTLLLSTDTDGFAVTQQSLLAFPRPAIGSGEHVNGFFSHLTSLPWVSMISPAELEEGSIALHESVDLASAHEVLEEALASEATVGTYSRVLETPQLLIDHERDRVLNLIGASHVQDPRMMREALEVFRAYDSSVLDGVGMIETEHTRLLGASSRIPVQVRNTLPFDAAVFGTVDAGSAALTVEEPEIPETIVPARSTVTHLVPVSTRVSSGESSLYVRLYDTNLDDHIETQRFPISVSTGIEAIAFGTLIAIALTLFGFGAVRSWIRHRR